MGVYQSQPIRVVVKLLDLEEFLKKLSFFRTFVSSFSQWRPAFPAAARFPGNARKPFRTVPRNTRNNVVPPEHGPNFDGKLSLLSYLHVVEGTLYKKQKQKYRKQVRKDCELAMRDLKRLFKLGQVRYNIMRMQDDLLLKSP